jgi:hypothetical protein
MSATTPDYGRRKPIRQSFQLGAVQANPAHKEFGSFFQSPQLAADWNKMAGFRGSGPLRIVELSRDWGHGPIRVGLIWGFEHLGESAATLSVSCRLEDLDPEGAGASARPRRPCRSCTLPPMRAARLKDKRMQGT